MNNNLELFKKRLIEVKAEYQEIADLQQALDFVLELTKNKEIRTDLLHKQTNPEQKTLAMPQSDLFELCKPACHESNILCLEKGLRDYVGGIDLSLVWAQGAIADTGTCLLFCADEEIRLATVLAEYSVILVKKSTIFANAKAAVPLMQSQLMQDEASYLSYITGPSRTADIERVLTLGAHGSLKLFVLIVD